MSKIMAKNILLEFHHIPFYRVTNNYHKLVLIHDKFEFTVTNKVSVYTEK